MATTYSPHAPAHAGTGSLAVYDSALLIGRIVLVLMFIYSGVGKFMDLSGTASEIASKGLPLPQVLAFLAGALELVGGLLIVVGWQTRLVALALLVYTLVAAYFFHGFWHLPDGPERVDAMIHAMKNLSIAGAFLMLFGTGGGRYAIDARR